MDTLPPSQDALNPLLQPWSTPFGVPPFAEIRAEHFPRAFEIALADHRRELDAIATQTDPASFDNTIVAFDQCGRLLNRIQALFNNLTSAETSPALQAIELELAAPLAAHSNAIYMNRPLFQRIDALYQQRDNLGLDGEQQRLLARVHLDFVRAGAKLNETEQARYGAIMEKLAELTTTFSQNVLADEGDYQLVLRSEADLAGLPDSLRAAAKQAALARGLNDAYVITLSRSLVVPFLMYSDRRDLRRDAYQAWTSRGEHEGPHDNRPIVVEIMKLRLEQAQIHGYASYADYALADTMAGTQAAVNDLLMNVWNRAVPKAIEECAALQAIADQESPTEKITIAPWDWRYYAEKVRKARYDLDEAAIKPYLSLQNMVEAAFDCAQRLFGITLTLRTDIPTYHPDVKVYEVRDANRLIGLFLHDNFARPSKQGGAWMSSYRLQSRIDGDVLPIVANHNNFAKGAEGSPTLLSIDDAETLFHEFGHGLHGLLSSVRYEHLSGTNVLRDFVELPSQLYEHWLMVPEVMKRFARHYQTGEPIPDELIAKIKAAATFNAGFDAVEFTASALVDMALHAQQDLSGLDISAFEQQQLTRLGMPSAIQMRHRLPHFLHLFAGDGYAAAYYAYLWAEVLDADAFEAFSEAGNAFDSAVATRLHHYIYSSGGSLPPMEAYRAFRGRLPAVDAMLKKKGLLTHPA